MKKTCLNSGDCREHRQFFRIVSQVSVERLLIRRLLPFEISSMCFRRIAAAFSAVSCLSPIFIIRKVMESAGFSMKKNVEDARAADVGTFVADEVDIANRRNIRVNFDFQRLIDRKEEAIADNFSSGRFVRQIELF